MAAAGSPADWAVVGIALTVLVLCRRLSSARLLGVATVVFAFTAASLFLELTSRQGVVARIGWYGLLVAGPLAVILVVMALTRYAQEHSSEK
jgi:MFS superfamily sulfate permease-like transporter